MTFSRVQRDSETSQADGTNVQATFYLISEWIRRLESYDVAPLPPFLE